MHLPRTLTIIAVLAIATAATASVDMSPKPGGIYRLKPGIYVRRDVACGSAPNAAIRQYDGRGINGAHTRACRARILSRRGTRFDVSQSCIDAGAGPAPRRTERQTVTVSDALTFSLRTRGAAATYRYCPSSMLPAGLSGAAR